jgi:hypothetical protein
LAKAKGVDTGKLWILKEIDRKRNTERTDKGEEMLERPEMQNGNIGPKHKTAAAS